MAEAQVPAQDPDAKNVAVKRESRNLNCLTISEKDSLCKFKQQNANISNSQLKAYAKEKFGKEPSSSQISRILQEPDKWAGREGKIPGARKVRNGKWPTLEAALTLLFAQERQEAQNVTASAILKKAREIAPELGIKDFTGSNTWAENFRTRSSFLDLRAPLPGTMTQTLTAPAPDTAHVIPDIDIAAVRQEILARLDPNAAPTAQQPLMSEPMTLAPAPVGSLSVNLEEAHHAAFVVASFMEQNPDKFPVSEQLTFERDIRAKLSKHLIDKMRQDKN